MPNTEWHASTQREAERAEARFLRGVREQRQHIAAPRDTSTDSVLDVLVDLYRDLILHQVTP